MILAATMIDGIADSWIGVAIGLTASLVIALGGVFAILGRIGKVFDSYVRAKVDKLIGAKGQEVDSNRTNIAALETRVKEAETTNGEQKTQIAILQHDIANLKNEIKELTTENLRLKQLRKPAIGPPPAHG